MFKRIILSVMVISLVVMMLGLGTFAYFSDTEKSTGNTFTSGSLDLLVNGENNPAPVITLANMCPCQTEYQSVRLTNNGSQDGVAWLEYGNFNGVDTVTTEPETEADPGGLMNDVQSWVYIDVSADLDGDGIYETVIIPADGTWMTQAGRIMLGVIPAGKTIALELSFHLSRDTGNAYQADTATFDATFGLEQAQ